MRLRSLFSHTSTANEQFRSPRNCTLAGESGKIDF